MQFSKNTQTSNFTKIRPVGAEMLHAAKTDGWTVMTKLLVAFHNSANVPCNKHICINSPIETANCQLRMRHFNNFHTKYDNMEFRIYTQTSGDYYPITMLQCVYKCPKWPPSVWIHNPARFSAPTRLTVLIAHMTPRGGAARNVS